MNEVNIIVNDGKVTGLIDFGDASYSSNIEDVAIFFSYAILSGLRSNDF